VAKWDLYLGHGNAMQKKVVTMEVYGWSAVVFCSVTFFCCYSKGEGLM
jgi:hypothetical protein